MSRVHTLVTSDVDYRACNNPNGHCERRTVPSELFAAGTIVVPFSATDGVVIRNSWRPLCIHNLFSMLNLQYLPPALINFVYATFRNALSAKDTCQCLIYIRIYLVPTTAGRITKEITSAIHSILNLVSRDLDAWEGRPIAAKSSDNPAAFFDHLKDNRSLSEIFQDLPSPRIDMSTVISAPQHVQETLRKASVWEAPPGMRSRLHPYQRRTVWRMLKQELYPGTAADPRFVSVKSLDDGRVFFYDPRNALLSSARDVTYDQPRGGILCEEMGCGKTCMCIAMCIATVWRRSEPPSTHQEPVAFTQLALDKFPFAPYNNSPPEMKYPTLAELARHVLLTSPAVNVNQELERVGALNNHDHTDRFEAFLSGWSKTPDECPFYLEHRNSFEEERTRGRRKDQPPPLQIFLSSITIILVPNMLHRQWASEFDKHCDDGALRILNVGKKMELPAAKSLIADYDVILMTHERFARETTTFSPGVRSALLDIRFQRVIIDEGHVANAVQSNLKSLAERLSVESRWVVTGTPTTNIKALNMGSLQEPAIDVVHESEGMDDIIPSSPLDTDFYDTACQPRDRPDLVKLGNMMRFLRVPPFLEGDADWSNTMIQPLLCLGGPQFGAVSRLLDCMSRVMIKHRAEDIEKDVSLPGLSHEFVTLDLDEYCAMTHNAMLAQIAINAIDSERTDQDYLFHPSNRRHLGAVVSNLSQSLFWHTDSETDFKERVRTAENSLETALKRNASVDDLTLVEKAIYHLRQACSNQIWRQVMTRESLPCILYAVPPELDAAWRRLSPSEASNNKLECATLLEPDRIIQLRKFAAEYLDDVCDNQFEALASLGREYALFDGQVQDYISNQKAEQKADKSSRSGKKNGQAQTLSPKNEAIMDVKVGHYPSGRSPTSHSPHRKRPAPSDPVSRDNWRRFSKPHPSSALNRAIFPPDALLSRATVHSSLSTKVNFILSEVLEHAASEKIIIFSSSPLSLAHLTEVFDVWRVKYLNFNTELNTSTREQVVLSFETSEFYRVLLMELKHGARGLNLVSASRVIFCEPVWRADVESQAIKRCHRIGQTRDVTVKTLVIRDTAEAEVVRVRKQRSRTDAPVKGMEDDVNIKDFIANPKFLQHRTTSWPNLVTPLLLTRRDDSPDSDDPPLSATPPQTPPKFRDMEPYGSQEEDAAALEIEPPKKKRRIAVRFAD